MNGGLFLPRRKRHEGEVAGAFDRLGEFALVRSAEARFFAVVYFARRTHEFAQGLIVLVVDRNAACRAKKALLVI